MNLCILKLSLGVFINWGTDIWTEQEFTLYSNYEHCARGSRNELTDHRQVFRKIILERAVQKMNCSKAIHTDVTAGQFFCSDLKTGLLKIGK